MKMRVIAQTVFSTTLIMALAGCGGGGGGSAQSTGASNAVSTNPTVSSVSVLEDGYGLQNPTYLTSSQSNGIFVMRAAIASANTDPNFRTVFRIDVAKPALIERSGTYQIGGKGSLPPFPGDILFFNGHQSTLLYTASGTITFTDFGTHAGDLVAGEFAVDLVDGYSSMTPQPRYTIRVNFRFVLDASGQVDPAPLPIPSVGLASYGEKCSSCHALGGMDTTAELAPDLALKGGNIDYRFTPGMIGHQGITLTANEVKGLKCVLNAQ